VCAGGKSSAEKAGDGSDPVQQQSASREAVRNQEKNPAERQKSRKRKIQVRAAGKREAVSAENL